tara:strand:+ start:283 stop:666 length:384 start_codon:yes stop_codon:yes gene_type:complete
MSTIKVGTLLHSDGSTTTQPSIPALDKRMAKAWLCINQTGTQAIRGSAFGVSSITDNGVGRTIVNLETAMADVNYAAVATAGGSIHHAAVAKWAATPTTTSFEVGIYRRYQSDYQDDNELSVIVFGN